MTEQFTANKCGNCGAQLARNIFSPTVTCGYCGTEYSTAEKPRSNKNAMADVADVKRKPGTILRKVGKGSFKEFLWIVIVLFLGIVTLGWLVSRIPAGGMVFLILLGIGAASVAFGRLSQQAPSPFIRANRFVLQNRSVVWTYFVLLICVGLAAIVFRQGEIRAAEIHQENAEIARTKAERTAKAKAEQERVEKEAALAKRLKQEAEEKEAKEKLESDVFAQHFRVLWISKNIPGNMNGLHARVAKKFKIKKLEAKEIFERRQSDPMPDEQPDREVKAPRWAEKKSFITKCGDPPLDLLNLVKESTVQVLKGKTGRSDSALFDTVSCTDFEPHRQKCWKTTCVWRGKSEDGSVVLNKWEYYFRKGEYKKHKVVFPGR